MRLWKQAVRQLFRAPGFLSVAALALALGIGSTTTIFSIVRAVFLRGLPYADPESLVQLRSSVPEQQIDGAGFSVPRYEAVRDRQTVFSALSYSAFTAFTLSVSGGEPEQVQGLQTAYDYLPLLGLAPKLGRGFTVDEDRPGGADVVLLSDGLWQRSFGARTDVVGQVVHLDGRPHTVIGVMPKDASRFPMNQIAVWTPRPQEVSFLVREQIDGGGFFFNVVARLKPGTTLRAAQAQVSTIAQAYSLSHPTNADTKASADVSLLLDALVGDQTATYLVLFAAVACLLLIASANVANLSLARYAARRKQIALRYALGAGPPSRHVGNGGGAPRPGPRGRGSRRGPRPAHPGSGQAVGGESDSEGRGGGARSGRAPLLSRRLARRRTPAGPAAGLAGGEARSRGRAQGQQPRHLGRAGTEPHSHRADGRRGRGVLRAFGRGRPAGRELHAPAGRRPAV